MKNKSFLKILVIDDNPSIHNDFIRILSFKEENKLTSIENQILDTSSQQAKDILLPHFQIDTALQGEAGIELIEKAYRESDPYILAFVDIRMPPGLNGIETIKRIWKIDPDIQIVICTAYSDYTWEETINELGGKENLLVLKKPFDIVTVRQLAFALTKKWQLLQEKRHYTNQLEMRVEERTQLLEYRATHDPLTDLPNRVFLLDRMNQLIEHAKRKSHIFGVLFFDLDRFKLINDSLGHSIGDKLLKSVAKRLKKYLRSSDTLTRLGGDEFVVLSTNLHHANDCAEIAAKLLSALKKPFQIADYQLNIRSSIGISIFPNDTTYIEDLLKNADTAMYKAKEMGGNQFQFYSTQLSKESLKRLTMENDLRRAVIHKEFILYYQPQFNIVTKEVISFEALIRWNHPEKGFLLPLDFIPLAEDIGLIIPIGEWVIREACLQNKQWQDSGLPKFHVTVNVGTKQIMQPNFVSTITKILHETQLEPKYLEIELTENVIIKVMESSIDALSELKSMGVRIALDDFGAGYSSMNYLRNLPLDCLKIDQSFISNINLNKSDEIIIQSIISMAKQLNLEVIAEGVESQKQIDFLISKNCDEIQGFYFSRAITGEEVRNFLQKK